MKAAAHAAWMLGPEFFYLTNCHFLKLEMFQMKAKGVIHLSYCQFDVNLKIENYPGGEWDIWIILTQSNRSKLLALSVVVFNV